MLAEVIEFELDQASMEAGARPGLVELFEEVAGDAEFD